MCLSAHFAPSSLSLSSAKRLPTAAKHGLTPRAAALLNAGEGRPVKVIRKLEQRVKHQGR